ncbi:MAG: hypothetical protein J0H88_13825 [Sphingomonadales bacterium]|nr:hypothetical protein [Sphingomonadales bacterium]
MINILSTPHRQQALVRAELMRQRDHAGRAIERIHADMVASAAEFVELTERWMASNPPALRGGK